MKPAVFFVLLSLILLVSCNRRGGQQTEQNKLVLRFEVDSNGSITSAEAREQLIALGKEIERTADKYIINAYTENSGNAEKDNETGVTMARAVRDLLKQQGNRNATGVGMEIKGYQNPVDSITPSNLTNRRIEIVPL